MRSCITGAHGEQCRFKQDSRQCGRMRHSEEQGVDNRRSDGCQKSYAPAVFVGTGEGEEIDGQPYNSALRDEVDELRQEDVAGNKGQGHEIGSGTGEGK